MSENIGLKQLREQREETIKRWEKLGLLDGLNGNVEENCAKLFQGQLSWIMDAGTTANDLWNDSNFITKRVEEQEDYLKNITFKYLNEEIGIDRFEDLKSSAIFQLEKFRNQKEFLLK